jgi:retron-type reverse transcriptase
VSQRLQHHLESYHKLNTNQSAYRSNCSTETALAAVLDSIARNTDSKKISLLLLLDMSAAFDTINHSILIQRLQHICVCDLALKWLDSYLTGKSQSVSVGGYKSVDSSVTLGVPQGSVLRPTLFNIYMTPVAELL